ncbi:UrcA family protein [Povalibacter sp.]|uniref:UrcA family protein n=1 Tax=Povalibacter sp. TaxID=1962978 RepID=UPI002F40593F
MKSLFPVLAALLATAAMTSAHANDSRAVEQREVRYDDLDLMQPGDVARLYGRIDQAAQAVCWTSGVLEVTARPRMKRCTAQALARAVADVDAPLLSDYYLARKRGSQLPKRTAKTDASRRQARTVVIADRVAIMVRA